MRICFFADGRSIHTHRWIDAVAGAGPVDSPSFEVHLASWDGYTGANERIVLHDLRSLAGAALTGHIPKARAVEWVIRARKAARNVVRSVRPDLVHGHFVRGYGHLALLSGIHPLVVSAWGSDIFEYPNQGGVSRALTRRTLRRSDLVTCDSAALREGVLRLGADDERIQIVQFGVDTEAFNPNARPDRARNLLGIEAGARVFLSPRAISPVYGTDVLIRAFAAVASSSNALLVLLGDAPDDSYRKDMERLTDTLGIAERVVFAGPQAFDIMPSMYAAADVVVSIARSDSSPVSLLEAMACGRVVVAADLTGVREWITSGDNGLLVDPNGEDSIAAGLANALDLPADRRTAWGAANRTAVVKRADYRVNMARAISGYEQLAAARPVESHPGSSNG